MLVKRSRTERQDYIFLQSQVTTETKAREILRGLSAEQKTRTNIAVRRELARARMGYSSLSFEEITIFKRFPITRELTEAAFMEEIWAMEAIVNAVGLAVLAENVHNTALISLLDTTV